MGLFDSIFGKAKKTNVTPNEDFPFQENLWFTNPNASSGGYNLRDFAAKRIRGENLGFGDDYLSRTTNPAIAQIDADFKERTLPTLSNEASKRGLSRSSIVQDQIGRADQSRNRDIEELVSKFYQLNEAQKKTDQTQALNLASGLQDQQRSMLADRASASERQVGRNIANDQYHDSVKSKAAGGILQAGGSLLSGPLGGTISQALGYGDGNMFSGFRPTEQLTTQDIYRLLGYGGGSGIATNLGVR